VGDGADKAADLFALPAKASGAGTVIATGAGWLSWITDQPWFR